MPLRPIQCGIVNLQIKEGRENYEGNVSLYAGDRYSNDTELYSNINEFELLNRKTLEGYFSGPVPFTGKKLTFDQVMKSKQKLVPENMNWDSTPPTLPDSNGYYEIPTPGKTKFI